MKDIFAFVELFFILTLRFFFSLGYKETLFETDIDNAAGVAGVFKAEPEAAEIARILLVVFVDMLELLLSYETDCVGIL